MISLQSWKLQKATRAIKNSLVLQNKFFFSSTANPKTGILMMNLGGPKKSEDAAQFMYNMFTDHQTVPILKNVPNFMIRKLCER